SVRRDNVTIGVVDSVSLFGTMPCTTWYCTVSLPWRTPSVERAPAAVGSRVPALHSPLIPNRPAVSRDDLGRGRGAVDMVQLWCSCGAAVVDAGGPCQRCGGIRAKRA